jgi:DNA end-binding protein Ku
VRSTKASDLYANIGDQDPCFRIANLLNVARKMQTGFSSSSQHGKVQKGEGSVSSRAIWQGTLIVQKQKLDVKFYSAVEDRQTHFHLLHKRDRTRVEQRMVEADTGKLVASHEIRKAFEAEPGLYVLVTPEEIESSAPSPAREVRISRCVPKGVIEPQLFDRPYYLGPSSDSTTDYFALAEALENKKVAGIAAWVMRKHSYVGALLSQQGYLMMITLRHADEVIPVTELDPPRGQVLVPKERDLAGKLIEALSGRFEPEAYHDTYQERVRELIDAKRSGKKLKHKRVPRVRAEGTLADSLKSSLKRISARRRA